MNKVEFKKLVRNKNCVRVATGDVVGMQGDTLIECDPEFLDVDVATVTAIESAQFSYPVPPKDCDEYDRVRFERVYERAKKRAGSLVEITLMITRKAKC